LTFATEGTYDYYCMPHQSLGMVGRFVVGEPGGPADGSMPEHGDVPESSTIVEEGSVSYEAFSGGGSTETATATETAEPTEAEDAETVTPGDEDPDEATTEASGPGFTAAGALSAIGAGALLRAYRNRDE
ncbi:MAG: plastocyanin/azurin family copper-binding protein, partial [Halanaeroarchaeum sp.]